jgi:ornithine cyclodeaminase/alanine dehydrogenase-like protein (mu-crystallin family)
LRRDHIYGNIGEIVARIKPGRETSSEISIYRSTGMAIAYVNIIAYEKARKAGVGTEISSLL